MANQKAESQAKEISELFVGNDEAKELARAMAREAIEKMKAEVRANPAARVRARASRRDGTRPSHPAPSCPRPPQPDPKNHARGLPDPRTWLSSQFTDMKEEMDHKFSLQMAENKRLQSNVRGPSARVPFAQTALDYVSVSDPRRARAAHEP